MIIEAVIIGGSLAASGALLADETNTDIYKPAKLAKPHVVNYFKDVKKYIDSEITKTFESNSFFLAWQQIKKAKLEEKNKEKKKEKVKTYLEVIRKEFVYLRLKESGCYGSENISVFTLPEHLSQVRRVLKRVFGTWSDKITTTYCQDNDNELSVYYTRQNIQDEINMDISVSYPLDNLPDGLLKPGCKIIRETKTVESCRIECAI